MTETPRSARPAPDAGREAPFAPARPPYLPAAASAVALFSLYALTLAPTTGFWDASEYIATAHIMGTPHPPGNPLFVLLARTWELLLTPLGLSVAVRINLFSALMSAGAAFFWFLVVHRVLSTFSESEWVRRIGATAAVVVSGTAFTVWNQSNLNEKVYTVTLFTIALISWVAFVWRDHVEAHRGQAPNRRWHDDNAILLVIFVLALSVANHLMAFLVAPALLVFLLRVKPRALLNWRLYPLAALVAALGLSVQLALPIRANLDPVINEASPQCEHAPSALSAVVTLGRVDGECPMLGASLRREQYQKPSFVTDRMAPFGAQLANFYQYFDWQWARSIDGTRGYLAPARVPFSLLFLLLGILGAVAHYKRDRTSFWYVGVLFFTLSFGLVYYMNFRFGYMQANVNNYPDSEVRERDYFYLITFSVWGLWVGVGLTSLWLSIARSLAPARRALQYASPVMAIALLPLLTNWAYATRAGDYAARDFAYNLLQSVEPYGILITNGDNDTFPLWYLQEVEGIRRDVTVIVMSYLNTHWYAQQLRDLSTPCEEPDGWRADETRILCQRAFEPEAAPEFYRGAAAPTSSALDLTDEQIAFVTASPRFRAPEGLSFEARGMEFRIPPGTVIDPSHQLVILMLQNAWGDRPFYFAATTNTHMDLGLTANTTRQGLAYKLLHPDEAHEGMLAMPLQPNIIQFTGGRFDPERNQRLLDEVFMFRNMPDRAVWSDDATRNIPMQYFYAIAAMATVADIQGDTAGADALMERAAGFQTLARER